MANQFQAEESRAEEVVFAMSLIMNTLLKDGQLAEGFSQLHELADTCHTPFFGPPQIELEGRVIPRWRGQRVGRLLVVCAGGLGDVLQFVRHVPLARDRVEHLTLCAPECLVSLFKHCCFADDVVSHEEYRAELNRADAFISHAFLLQHVLQVGYQPFHYLIAPNPLTLAGGLHVGLCWESSNREGRSRSIEIREMETLLQLSSVTFHSLIPGVGSQWCVAHDLPDYAATANLVASLDLVITVDTSVAHLAGSMGKETWVLLPEPADWRWENEANRSRWYPSARLFRQSTPGEWNDVISRVFRELAGYRA